MGDDMNVSKRPLWRRITDPDEPLVWAGRLNFLAIGLALLSIVISVWG